MIPNINTVFQTLQPDTSSINFRIAKFKEATQDLINAVAYANENEMAMLVDRAISNGAKINYNESYENHLMVIAVRKRQMHAIPILMARGIDIPVVPKNGIDILMIAAAAGSEELIDPLTVASPLGLALKSKQASSVALLLARGAPIEKFDAEENTLWDEAFINEKKPWELLDLLVTTNPLCNITSPDYSKENFLITFFENCQNPIPLAAQGFYPSMVELSRDELQRLHANESSLSKMEKQLLTAFILSTTLKKLPEDSDLVTESSGFIEPDDQWLKLTLAKK